MDEVVDRIYAMRQQEESKYAYRHFLPRIVEGAPLVNVVPRLNIVWREKICQWTYNVVDHFDLSREVVAVSLCFFDRYLATQGNQCTGNLALLTSLTTLHIAVKLHDTKKVKLSTLANLSRGQFTTEHIEEMEWSILAALGWRLHPPTQYSFVAHFLFFLPQEAHPAVRKELFELSRYLTELSVCDSYFVEVHNSTVAFAAILNVMEDMSYARLSAGIREKFLRELAQRVGHNYFAEPVVVARERLRTMFAVTGSPVVEPFMMNAPSNTPPIPSSSREYNNGCAGTAPAKPYHHHQPPENDSLSLTGGSISSAGSNGSRIPICPGGTRSRSSSIDSKGSCRYSPSPSRRRFAISPMASSRALMSLSPAIAGVQ